MTADFRPAQNADAWGVQTTWVDAHDQSQEVSPDLADVMRQLIGRPPADLEEHAPIVARTGQDLGLGEISVTCEDGETRQARGTLPDDFPLGYHEIATVDGGRRSLIVSPGRCWLPEQWRAWGWAVQLYAARSRRSWGIGDLADLKTLREWSQSIGAGFLLVNPLHAVSPTLPQEDSPYLPATRRFRNPIYLSVDTAAADTSVDVSELSELGRALNDSPVIDRDEVWRLKRVALRRIFETTRDDDEFDAWRQRQGQALREFALWCALADEQGPDWRDWDAELHDPAGEAVRRFEGEGQDDVAFHAWLQWQLERQLHDATGDLLVLQDLPIGVAAGGADAWVWQDQLASGATIGAPPDFFNPAGQNWGSPPPIPWRLRAGGYQAFIEAIRATMAHAGGLRIDHVMGLFRLWWVPADGSAANGAYVRYQSGDLLDIVALESQRAQAVVVGEDLGTVEPGVRAALADRNVLSYRLLYFEDEQPQTWPVKSMAAVTTHDLPTVAGLWTGSDSEEQRDRAAVSAAEITRGRESLLAHLAPPGGLAPAATVAEVTEGAYRRLADAPSLLLSATLEDATGDVRRPNMPGASDRDNWCLPLPVSVDDLPNDRLALLVADILRAAVD